MLKTKGKKKPELADKLKQQKKEKKCLTNVKARKEHVLYIFWLFCKVFFVFLFKSILK
jgi:hypothetical protein